MKNTAQDFLKQLMRLTFIAGVLAQPLHLMAQTDQDEDEEPHYDSVVVHDPEHYNIEHLKIYTHKGQVVRMGDLLNGKKEGIWKEYYENGILSRVMQYHEDVLNGISLMFETSGMLMRDDNFLNGKPNGLTHEYSGSYMTKEENYTNGILNGWRKVFSNGIIQEEGGWKMGKRDSINYWYYPGGTLSVQYYYKTGNINGPSISYYENGNIKSKGNYVDNYEDGAWIEYYQSGKESAEGSYKNGKKAGTWKVFNENGSLQKTQQYEDGNMIKETVAKK